MIIAQPQSKTRINGAIKASQVRLIDGDGQQVGVFDTPAAMEMAQAQDVDLVEVAPDASPPVCRLMNYGKYRYDQEKRAKEARKKQHQVQLKTVRIKTPNISDHDLTYRLTHIREFIKQGNRVKVSVRFRGRQMAYQDRARELLDAMGVEVKDVAAVDQPPKMEGREMSLLLIPL
jgi:translation initiation factor IF-3